MRIELYGIARSRAGVASVEVEAHSLADALRALAVACPALREEVVLADGALSRHFVASLNGERFISDPATPMEPTDSLLVLGSQAGG